MDERGLPTTLDTSISNEVQKLEISKASGIHNKYIPPQEIIKKTPSDGKNGIDRYRYYDLIYDYSGGSVGMASISLVSCSFTHASTSFSLWSNSPHIGYSVHHVLSSVASRIF